MVKVEDKKEEEKADEPQEKFLDESSIIFSIDHSGSMEMDRRLISVKKVLHAQIDDMVKDNPEKSVGIVTFEEDVNIIGDGTK